LRNAPLPLALNRLNREINNRIKWDEDVARRSPNAAKQPLTDAEVEARRTELQQLARSSLVWRAFMYFLGCFACQAFWTALILFGTTQGWSDPRCDLRGGVLWSCTHATDSRR